jgi:hypothetical protein
LSFSLTLPFPSSFLVSMVNPRLPSLVTQFQLHSTLLLRQLVSLLVTLLMELHRLLRMDKHPRRLAAIRLAHADRLADSSKSSELSVVFSLELRGGVVLCERVLYM